jgi:4-carboxymuconolactone decarboxylase
MADWPPISFPETRKSKGEFMYLPKVYRNFQDHFPEVFNDFKQLGISTRKAGPLDEKIQNLVKLGIAVGANSRGGVMSNTRKAIAAGATAEDVRHAVLLAMTTTGFPNMIAALSWVEEVLSGTDG